MPVYWMVPATSIRESGMSIPDQLAKNIKNAVHRDLDPGPWSVNLRVGSALILGGMLSLFLCGQFGFGYSRFASGLHHYVHVEHGSTLCMVVCGFSFVLIPIILLRILTRPLMFRKIVRSKKMMLFIWLAVAEFLLTFRGSYLPSPVDATTWFVVAMGTLWGASVLIDRMSKYFYRVDVTI